VCVLKSSLRGVLSGPLLSNGVILFPVGFIQFSDIGDQGVVGIGVSEQGANRQQEFGDGQGRRPLGPQEIQADGAVAVDIGMVDPGSEGHLGWFEGVIAGEFDLEEENPSVVGAVRGPGDGRCPRVQIVVADWSSRAQGDRVLANVVDFLHESRPRHPAGSSHLKVVC